MNYFKNTNNEIFAYDDEKLSQVSEYNDSPSRPETDVDETVKYKENYPQSVVILAEKVNALTEITEAEKDELLKPSDEQLAIQHANSEHAWVKSELNAVSIKLMYHWTGDRRKSHTEQAWRDYAIALRDYTTTDADGNPIVIGESRPGIDSYL